MRNYFFKTPSPQQTRPTPNDRDRPEYKIALAVFARVQESFPNLTMTLDRDHEHLDLALDLLVQDGLEFDVQLNLQNIDELFLCAASFWCSWFPCTEPKVTERFFDAVSGLLSGRYRILEHKRGERLVKSQVQCPHGDGWKTIATAAPFPTFAWTRKTYNILQNTVH